MLYAILCYNDEDAVFSWSKAEDDAVMAKLAVVHQKLAAKGKLGPTARLMPTACGRAEVSAASIQARSVIKTSPH